RGQQHGRQNGDDGDNHQQFNQGETAGFLVVQIHNVRLQRFFDRENNRPIRSSEQKKSCRSYVSTIWHYCDDGVTSFVAAGNATGLKLKSHFSLLAVIE